jgi:aminoglycoside 2''-phosphotransferase
MLSGSSPLQRVLELIPHLQVRSLRAGEDGLVNDVLIVNQELVFRFARTEAARQGLEREAQMLALVRPRVSLAVPEIVQQQHDCMVCRFIPGVPLDRSAPACAGRVDQASDSGAIGRVP